MAAIGATLTVGQRMGLACQCQHRKQRLAREYPFQRGSGLQIEGNIQNCVWCVAGMFPFCGVMPIKCICHGMWIQPQLVKRFHFYLLNTIPDDPWSLQSEEFLHMYPVTIHLHFYNYRMSKDRQRFQRFLYPLKSPGHLSTWTTHHYADWSQDRLAPWLMNSRLFHRTSLTRQPELLTWNSAVSCYFSHLF